MKIVNSADLFLDGQFIGHSDKENPSQIQTSSFLWWSFDDHFLACREYSIVSASFYFYWLGIILGATCLVILL